MKNVNVLYVEDDEYDVTLLKHSSRKAGVELPLRHVSDGEIAVRYLSGHGKYRDRAEFPLPQLMLLDVKMPVMDGLSVLKWTRSQRELAGLVVIMFSSSDEESDVRKSYERGANSYLLKPSGLEAYITMVRSLRSWWVEHNLFSPPLRRAREHGAT